MGQMETHILLPAATRNKQKDTWNLQVYLGTINLTLILPSVQVIMLNGEIMIMTMRVTGLNLKGNFHGGPDHDQILLTTLSED